jgi:hypothetical protein
MIKAIETQYKGYRFRSRLEARWAVFFDALGTKWEYEPEGFKLSDGTRYLPDFWLPTFSGGMWAEVKPDGDPFEKARKFVAEAKQNLWMCEGTPAARVYFVLHPIEKCRYEDAEETERQDQCPVDAWVKTPFGGYTNCDGCRNRSPYWTTFEDDGIPGWDHGQWEDRMFWGPGYSGGTIPEEDLQGDSLLEQAVMAARSARFER